MCTLLLLIVFVLIIFASSGDKATVVKKKEEWVLLHQEKDAHDHQEETLTDCLEKDNSTSSDTQKFGSHNRMRKRKSKDDKVKHGVI